MNIHLNDALGTGSIGALRGFVPSRHLRAAAAALAVWRRRFVTRRRLAELDPRMLEDIGIRPIDAAREASKPFWRA